MYAEVGLDLLLDGPVATIVLDRPEQLNAQTPEMWAAMRDIGERMDASVRVVVIRANGRAFSAGLDRALFRPDGIGALAGAADDAADALIRDYQAGFTWLRRPEFVSVAAVQGHAIGAGFQLALACDLRVLAADAQLCMAETSLGIVPDLGGSKPLVDAVGFSRALEICVTGRRVGVPRRRSAWDWPRSSCRSPNWTRRRLILSRRCSPLRPARCGRPRPCCPAPPSVTTASSSASSATPKFAA